MRKFTGLCCMLAMVAAAALGFNTRTDAGLLGNRGGLLGLGLLSSAQCGGGGGLGAYSGCGGGGGLGAYWGNPAPVYVQPDQFVQANCPGGVCTINARTGQVVAGSFRATIPADIARSLAPHERYVAGSLRRASSVEVRTVAAKPKAVTATQYVSTTAGKKTMSLLVEEGCVHCPGAKQEAEKAGIDVEIVDIKENPRRAMELWRGAPEEFKAPAFVLLRNGEPQDWHIGSKPAENLRASLGLPPLAKPEVKLVAKPAAEKEEAQPSTNSLLVELIAEIRAERDELRQLKTAIEGIKTASTK